MTATPDEVPSTQPGALAGIRVIEFAQNVAVPTCGRALAAMGAEVIKVEPPGGDATRKMAPFPGLNDGRTYALVNPGKRSVVLDLGDARSHPAKDALIRSADVVLCAFKGPDLARYGLAYEHVASINPNVIFLEHRALGSVGPDAEEGGYDVLVQGLSGLSFVTSRSEHDRPAPVRPAYSDLASGLASLAAVLGALFHRAQTGHGQRVHTSLLGTAHWLAMPINGRFDDQDGPALQEFTEDLALLRHSGASFDDQRAFFESRVLPQGGAFDLHFRHYLTADSFISVGALSPALISRFYAATGLTDYRLERPAYRSPEWMSLIRQAEELFRSDTTDAWITRLRAAGVPCSPYYLPTEAINDPGAIANGFVEDLVHPSIGRYRTTSTPLAMDKSPVRTTGPSPSLGADTAAVLTELGFDAALIEALERAGITRPVPEIGDSPAVP